VHSLQIWQKVKAANQNFTVCEIGATIGRLWREMTDVDKQQYNDDFAHDKVAYVVYCDIIHYTVLCYSCVKSGSLSVGLITPKLSRHTTGFGLAVCSVMLATK